MKDIREKRRRLQVILAAAHRRREAAASGLPGPAWRAGLMQALARLDADAARAARRAFLGRLVWRMVPAAGGLALLLAALVVRLDPDPAGDLARLMSADPPESGLYALYQSEALHE